MTVESAVDLISLAEIENVELAVARRMHEHMLGAHPSIFQESGFEFVGLRDWQPGDRLSSTDWPASTLTNFSPLVTREFEQQSTARLVIVADTSLSTRCGVNGVPIASLIARTVALLGFSAAVFQDSVGLITFDERSRQMDERPKVGRNQVLHCVRSYQDQVFSRGPQHTNQPRQALAGLLRKVSVVPVISDFLFEDYEKLFDEIRMLQSTHDAFVVLVDSSYAFELPVLSDGWIEGMDVETGKSRLFSMADVTRIGASVSQWQDGVEIAAKARGLEVLRVNSDSDHFYAEAIRFMANRRMKKWK